MSKIEGRCNDWVEMGFLNLAPDQGSGQVSSLSELLLGKARELAQEGQQFGLKEVICLLADRSVQEGGELGDQVDRLAAKRWPREETEKIVLEWSHLSKVENPVEVLRFLKEQSQLSPGGLAVAHFEGHLHALGVAVETEAIWAIEMLLKEASPANRQTLLKGLAERGLLPQRHSPEVMAACLAGANHDERKEVYERWKGQAGEELKEVIAEGWDGYFPEKKLGEKGEQLRQMRELHSREPQALRNHLASMEKGALRDFLKSEVSSGELGESDTLFHWIMKEEEVSLIEAFVEALPQKELQEVVSHGIETRFMGDRTMGRDSWKSAVKNKVVFDKLSKEGLTELFMASWKISGLDLRALPPGMLHYFSEEDMLTLDRIFNLEERIWNRSESSEELFRTLLQETPDGWPTLCLVLRYDVVAWASKLGDRGGEWVKLLFDKLPSGGWTSRLKEQWLSEALAKCKKKYITPWLTGYQMQDPGWWKALQKDAGKSDFLLVALGGLGGKAQRSRWDVTLPHVRLVLDHVSEGERKELLFDAKEGEVIRPFQLLRLVEDGEALGQLYADYGYAEVLKELLLQKKDEVEDPIYHLDKVEWIQEVPRLVATSGDKVALLRSFNVLARSVGDLVTHRQSSQSDVRSTLDLIGEMLEQNLMGLNEEEVRKVLMYQTVTGVRWSEWLTVACLGTPLDLIEDEISFVEEFLGLDDRKSLFRDCMQKVFLAFEGNIMEGKERLYKMKRVFAPTQEEKAISFYTDCKALEVGGKGVLYQDLIHPLLSKWPNQVLESLPESDEKWVQVLSEEKVWQAIDAFSNQIGMYGLKNLGLDLEKNPISAEKLMVCAMLLHLLSEAEVQLSGVSKEEFSQLMQELILVKGEALTWRVAGSALLPWFQGFPDELVSEEVESWVPLEALRSKKGNPYPSLTRYLLDELEKQGVDEEILKELHTTLYVQLKGRFLRDGREGAKVLEVLGKLADDTVLSADEKGRVLERLSAVGEQKNSKGRALAVHQSIQAVSALLLLRASSHLVRFGKGEEAQNLLKEVIEERLGADILGGKEEAFHKVFLESRDPEAVFDYTARVCSLGLPQVTAFWVKILSAVLEGRWEEMRFDPEQSPHVKKVFGERPELLEKWKQPREFLIGDLMKEAEVVKAQNSESWLKMKLDVDAHIPKEKLSHFHGFLKGEGRERGRVLQGVKKKIKEKDVENPGLLQLELQLMQLCHGRQGKRSLKALKSLKSLLQSHQQEMGFETSLFMHDIEARIQEFSSEAGKKLNPDFKVTCHAEMISLLLTGTEIPGSCQHVRGMAGLNVCLMDYMRNAAILPLMIQKDPGAPIQSRALLRVLWDPKNQKPVLFRDRVYGTPEEAAVINVAAKKIAEELGLPLLVKEGEGERKPYGASIQAFESEAPFGYADSATVPGVQVQGAFEIDEVYWM